MTSNRRVVMFVAILAGATVFGSACKDGIAHLASDAGHLLLDAADSMHDGAAAQGGSPAQVVTADTDSIQLRTGMTLTTATNCSDVVEISNGPFVLTDAVSTGGSAANAYSEAYYYSVPSGETCQSGVVAGGTCFVASGTTIIVSTFQSVYANGNIYAARSSLDHVVHGGRYSVPVGRKLCLVVPYGGASWAGFVPYR